MAKMKRAKPHPKWGASAAQAAHYEEVRELRNKIHQLEIALSRATSELAMTPPRMGSAAPLIEKRDVRIEVLEGRLDELRAITHALATGKVPQ